jgi:predicted NBD/HSP70 family sugar kinase
MTSALGEIPRAAFGVALQRREVTRRELTEELGVSFPTVTAALSELIGADLIQEVRREQGPRGRASLVYGITPTAGWVLGLDIGSTQVACLAQGLDGTELFRAGTEVPRDIEAAGRAAAELLRKARAAVPAPLRGIAIAVNQVVPHAPRGEAGASYPRAARMVALALDGIDIERTPVAVENNVNCAAVAEHEDGAMTGLPHCAYLQIGVGIGLGFFVEGALVRGAAGASGELAQIPVSWDAAVPSPGDAIERRYGSVGMLERAAAFMGASAPRSAEELFSRAESGDETSELIMTEHAVAVARIATAAATVIDPAVVVVGGGLAKNDVFVARMREEFSMRLPHIELRPSAKGTGATLQGAVLIARDLALAVALGPRHRRLVPRPALWNPAAADE